MTLANASLLTSVENANTQLILQAGKQCQLIYPTQEEQCSNCYWDSMKRSSTNVYRTGGPQPFGQGMICPMCGGKGLRMTPEATEVITMLCKWNPKQFNVLPGVIVVPYSTLLTKGFITDLPKVLKARRMLLQVPIQPYIAYRFELDGEPTNQEGFTQGIFFHAYWKRSG